MEAYSMEQVNSRRTNGCPQTVHLMCLQHLYLGSSTPIDMYPMELDPVQQQTRSWIRIGIKTLPFHNTSDQSCGSGFIESGSGYSISGESRNPGI
jgi:hypothetical protein